MAKEQHVTLYAAVSSSFHPNLNQNPEGFQHGETWKESAFCQGSNHSASSLVNQALPLQEIWSVNYEVQRKAPTCEIWSVKEAHIHTLGSVFHSIFLSLLASIFVRLPASFSNPIPSCWSFLQGRVLKSAWTELSPPLPLKNSWPFSPFWILLPASPSV